MTTTVDTSNRESRSDHLFERRSTIFDRRVAEEKNGLKRGEDGLKARFVWVFRYWGFTINDGFFGYSMVMLQAYLEEKVYKDLALYRVTECRAT